MRDRLPTKPHRNESGFVNLDNSENAGTHWVAYAKKGNNAVYFDGFAILDYQGNSNTLSEAT